MRRMKVLWGAIFVLVLLQVLTLSYFLTEQEEETPQQSNNTYGQDGYAAQVGDERIKVEEFIARLVRDYGENTLDDMINRKLIFSESERLGLTISEEEIEREINHLRKDYSTEEEFYRALRDQIGISPKDLREEIRYYLLTEEMATKDIVITEEQMRTYYQENIDIFFQPTRFHLHQILVQTKEEALQVIKEIEQGSSFEAVAAERSIDMITSPDGGDMGMVSSNDFFLPYSIVEVAEEITLNQISSPIETEDGYSVIKVSERIMGGQKSFEEVKGKIRREMALQEIDGVSIFLDRLRENVGVKNYIFQLENSN
jgi:foldase protein PrsA